MSEDGFKRLLDNNAKEFPVKLDKDGSNLFFWKKTVEDFLSQHGAKFLLEEQTTKPEGVAEQADKKIVIMLRASIHIDLATAVAATEGVDTASTTYKHILDEFSADPEMMIISKAKAFYEISNDRPNILELDAHIDKLVNAYKELKQVAGSTKSYDYQNNPDNIILDIVASFFPVEKIDDFLEKRSTKDFPTNLKHLRQLARDSARSAKQINVLYKDRKGDYEDEGYYGESSSSRGRGRPFQRGYRGRGRGGRWSPYSVRGGRNHNNRQSFNRTPRSLAKSPQKVNSDVNLTDQ